MKHVAVNHKLCRFEAFYQNDAWHMENGFLSGYAAFSLLVHHVDLVFSLS